MRQASEAERVAAIERHKDAPIVVSVRPCVDGGGWEWHVGGPFRSERGHVISFNGEGDEAKAREMAEKARAVVEADPETYTPSVIWIPEDDDWDD